MRALMWPGMSMQKLTTREPDDAQIEVALRALTEVLAMTDKVGAESDKVGATGEASPISGEASAESDKASADDEPDTGDAPATGQERAG